MANKMPKQSRGFWAFIALAVLRLLDGRKWLFAPREIFIRQGTGTKRIILDTGTQIQLAIIAAGLLFWFAYSTSGVMMGKTSTHAMQDRLSETHNAYENRVAEMQEEYEQLNLKLILAKKEFSRMAQELEIRHDHLAALIGMHDRLGATMRKRNKTNRAIKNKLQKKIRNKKESYLTPLRNSSSVFLTSRPAGSAHAAFPAAQATASSENFNGQAFYGLGKTGSPEIDAIGKKLAALDQMQRAILDHFEEKITRSTQTYERAFHTTEAIEPDLFAERIEQNQLDITSGATNLKAVGGPFLPIAQAEQIIKSKALSKTSNPAAKKPFMPVITNENMPAFLHARKQVNKVHQKLKKLIVLDRSVSHLPLAKPMPSYYVTSAFGPRIDPFTREWSFHTGVDIAGFIGNSIHAVLPGRVVFVGKARGYGMMIELDHGHGIKTRYGHLKNANVKFGQKIKFKQNIGVMGSTGRSTGKHLHYEILIDDKPYDPWKFIEAGKYVFEIAG